MSKLYLTATSDAVKTARTARGHHWVKTACQSWDGSISLLLDEHGNAEIRVEEGSTSTPGHLILAATIQDLLNHRGALA